MRGHVRKYKPGTWHVVVDLPRDADGKRKQKWITVHGDEDRAHEVLAQTLSEIYTDKYVDTGDMTLADWLIQWLQMIKPPATGTRTWESYAAECRNRIIPALGDKRLAKIKPLHIQQFYAKLLETPKQDGSGTLSPTTVRYVHRVLHVALEEAVKLGALRSNPADRIRLPKRKKHEAVILNAEESAKLLQVSAGSRYHAPIVLAILCGMRESEILGLRWKDIHWDQRTITITQTLENSQTNGLYLKKTAKSDGSRRTIKISPGVVAVLKKHRAIQAAERLKAGPDWQDHDLVMTNLTGGPCHPSTLYHGFKRILKRHGLPNVRFHDLRHGQASLLLAKNIPMKAVSERLGHSSITITMDLYSHLLSELQDKAAEALDDLLPDAHV